VRDREQGAELISESGIRLCGLPACRSCGAGRHQTLPLRRGSGGRVIDARSGNAEGSQHHTERRV